MAVQLDMVPWEAVEYVAPLPHVPGAVSALRRQVRALLDDWRVSPEIVDDSLLVVSELLTNAIMHAVPPAELRLSWDRRDGLSTLRIEVTDGGPVLAPGQSLLGIDPDEHGRGESIVHALATRHGIRVHPGGVTRWADLVAL
ncbi:ATP-binding protein [Streptomyces olivochromogenes]|uniref:ATP-binding protein n=1 Tax=Streptomyces olivochromogenes TaxID=1963 RepID=UPI001F295349|nr:ATP-binding protein [Streptomyces olivochromogenes]MCF3135973.1 ATP-binding protein [Streptomyces olivochromogenes]